MIEAEPRLARDAVKLAGSRKARGSRWPELDARIEQTLIADPTISARQIFEALPDSFGRDEYYRDGDEIFSEKGKSLQFGGFEKRVSKIRKQVKNSR